VSSHSGRSHNVTASQSSISHTRGAIFDSCRWAIWAIIRLRH